MRFRSNSAKSWRTSYKDRHLYRHVQTAAVRWHRIMKENCNHI